MECHGHTGGQRALRGGGAILLHQLIVGDLAIAAELEVNSMADNAVRLAAAVCDQFSGGGRFQLDLADALAGNVHVLADTVQIEVVVIVGFAAVLVLEGASLALDADNLQFHVLFLAFFFWPGRRRVFG